MVFLQIKLRFQFEFSSWPEPWFSFEFQASREKQTQRNQNHSSTEAIKDEKSMFVDLFPQIRRWLRFRLPDVEINSQTQAQLRSRGANSYDSQIEIKTIR